MKKLFLALALIIPTIGFSQTAETPKPAPSTKLEAFSGRTGIVAVKGFTELGVISGIGGKVEIDVREFRDASNPKSTIYGASFQVKEIGRLERENTSFIDEDEMDGLLKGLDYIQGIKRDVTTLSNFEASYRTKGDLSFTVFSQNDGSIGLAVSSGRIGKTSVYLKLTDIERIRNLLSDAKNAITAAKSAK